MINTAAPAAVGGALAVADGLGIIDTATAEIPQERCTTCNRVLSSPGCREICMHGSWYPGYQRFFSRAAGIFGVGRRPKPNRARKVSGTQGRLLEAVEVNV